MIIISRNAKTLIILSLFGLLSACDSNQPIKDLQAYIDQLQSVKSTAATDPKAATKNIESLEPAKYTEETRRSPFQVLDVTPSKGSTQTNPLQAYPLDMLRFVGTVTNANKTTAFIAAPDNKIYQVKEGDIMGDRNGKIVSIESDRISLVEQGANPDQANMKQVVTLQLKEASP